VTFTFDQPALLLLGLIALPLVVLGWRAMRGTDLLRRTTILAARTILLVGLAVTLAGPSTRREHDHLTVIGLLDISGSVRRFAEIPTEDETATRTYLQHLREWFRAATASATGTRTPDDRFGLVVFDGEAIAVAPPTRALDGAGGLDDDLDVSTAAGTNIAEAIRLGLAMFPGDTARRLVLVTDGNETVGDAVAAARAAAGVAGGAGTAVPIDVLPVAYRVAGDVQIARVEAPSYAQPGQTVTVRIIVDATDEASGRLTLRREGEAVDLDPAAPGRSRRVDVPAGRSVHLATVVLGESPVNRFEAVFEPDDPAADGLPDNNRAEAFTPTPGKGRILVVDGLVNQRANPLADVLRAAGLPVDVEPPGLVPGDLLALQNFDLVVLDNVPAYELTTDQQTLLGRYVNDLGGGLIMVGGERSFGAGGWNGTPVEEVLPLELDPPKELRLPEAALVLVLDQSGSMSRPVAGARASQQEVANEAAALAIESLRAESLVGVVTFHSFATEHVPLQRNDDPSRIARRVRSITAGGGTNIAPALRTAQRMLNGVEADRKRVVCLSDGQSPTGGLEKIAEQMAAEGIRLTTIAVGDDADHETLKRLADIGGGAFYPVYNPKALPRVLVDSVQVINKPLVKEGPFVPVVRPTGSTLTIGMDAAPPLGGLVVTAPRDDPRAAIEMTHPDGEPLLAQWQAGLGRAAAFTSDSGGAWSESWAAWPTGAAFWTQLARNTARPAVSHEAELIPTFRDDRLEIMLEASGDDEGFLDYLEVTGTVYAPDGTAMPVRLPQTAPGRYETSVPAREAGNYIVALNPRRGGRRLAPVIGGASRPTGAEFRRYRSDLAVLDRIASETGGRRLDLAAPEAVDLFDRAGMPVSVALLPLWPLLLWVALGLLLLDVACRRIAWSGAAIRALVVRAVTRVTPAHVRGGEVAATLASLREVSDRRPADLRGGEPSAPPPAPAPRASAPEEAAPPEPSKVSAALDVLLGRAKEDRPRAATGDDDAAPEPRDADADAASETTSSLLAAKRKARDRLK
jgi:Mg-chelatase subunit ChlD